MLTKLSKLHTVCVKNSIPNFSVSYRYQSSTATSHASHTSLDPKEINTFNQQAKTFWDPAGSSKVLQEMNSVRVPFIRQCLQTQPLNTAYLLKSQQAERLKNAALEEEEEEYDEYCLPLLGKNILDVGCGAGLLCEPLARLGANVVGIDASENMISIAKQRQENISRHLVDSSSEDIASIQYINTTIEDLKNLPNLQHSFDAVVSSEVFEHIENHQKPDFLQNLKHFCNIHQNGSIILSTMGKNLKSYLVTIVGAEKILQKVPEGTHDYEKYIDYVELSQMLLKLNEPSFTQVSLTDESKVSSVKQLKIQAVEGMFYNLITQRWSFSDDRDVNYILHAKFH